LLDHLLQCQKAFFFFFKSGFPKTLPNMYVYAELGRHALKFLEKSSRHIIKHLCTYIYTHIYTFIHIYGMYFAVVLPLVLPLFVIFFGILLFSMFLETYKVMSPINYLLSVYVYRSK